MCCLLLQGMTEIIVPDVTRRLVCLNSDKALHVSFAPGFLIFDMMVVCPEVIWAELRLSAKYSYFSESKKSS